MSVNNEIITFSRKEREKKGRQQEILQAARALFAEKGYHDTTLEEIAHKAEFAKGTIYNYFANKDEMFYGIIENVFDEMDSITAAAMATPGTGAREKLTAYAKAVISHSMAHSDLFMLMLRQAHHQLTDEFDKKIKNLHERDLATRTTIAQVLAEDISNEHLKAYDPLEITFLFEGMLRSYCMYHIKARHQLTAAEIDRAADLIVAVYFDGIQNK